VGVNPGVALKPLLNLCADSICACERALGGKSFFLSDLGGARQPLLLPV
jgi:hypothetical protein